MEMPETLANLIQTFRVKHVPKGQILLYQGDDLREIFVLKSGVVKVHNIDDQGNEKVLHLLGPTAIAPLAFFSGPDATTRWFYTALTDCDVYVASDQALQDAMHTDGSVAIYLMNWFSQEVHELLVRLNSMGKTNVRDKLIAALKFLAASHSVLQKSGWVRVHFPVSHQLIADITGITRESAATGMKELTDKKFVRYPRFMVLEINPAKFQR